MKLLEITQHIQHCGQQMLEQYALFKQTNDPAYRKAACEWLELQNEAIRTRNNLLWAGQQDAIEQRMDTHNEDYFTAAGGLAANAIPPCFSAVTN